MESIEPHIDLVIFFRGKKIEIPLTPNICLVDVKSHLASTVDQHLNITAHDIKIIHKGKVITGHEEPGQLFNLLSKGLNTKKIDVNVKLMATGYSSTEASDVEKTKLNVPRVRDDLSEAGKREIIERKNLGKKLMLNSSKKMDSMHQGEKYGFGRIETLPMLPEQNKAKAILTSLANDPGILACMAKRKWNVGCLAELYPEGKVGESEVCIMGLNQNNGVKILLRLRTDDLKGFRKILSIRKVLFHELAHNVHSEHNGDFFKLMRQIEKECNELDWTEGAGRSTIELDTHGLAYQGGTYRLGGSLTASQMATRDLAARAAMTRLSEEEEEIRDACGCGKSEHGQPLNVTSQGVTTSNDIIDRTEGKMEK
mmetsp:Transcript_19052/g.22023  ORF Transcript_19052/g.22023 Transcript_19052/m.22023 type:complete len:369 (+) Transcript_19052:111-1217(+)